MMRPCLTLVLVALASAAVGCGETANTIGQVSNEGGSSVGGSGVAGSVATAGSTAASGAANGGSASGGAGGTASGGSESGGVASGGSAVGGSGGGSSLQCDEPQALDGNWEMCGGARTLHRPTPGKCTFTPSNAVLRPSGNDQCLKDSDCTAQPFGTCRVSTGISGSVNYCDYGCEVDADCDAGSICVCADASISSFGSWGVTRAGSCQRIANCMSDQDCPGGNWCAPYDSNPGCYSPVFACTTAQDECTKPSDCAGFPHESCTFDGTRRVCQAAGCVVD